jgi:hypothetical protein
MLLGDRGDFRFDDPQDEAPQDITGDPVRDRFRSRRQRKSHRVDARSRDVDPSSSESMAEEDGMLDGVVDEDISGLSLSELQKLARRASRRPPKESPSAARRKLMMEALHFDPEVAKHAWRKVGVDVPGTYNPNMPERPDLPHGARCPLCKLAPDVVNDGEIMNHLNVILSIQQMCGSNGSDMNAKAAMISSYWESNVRAPRADDGKDPGEMTHEMTLEHLKTLVLSGMDAASKSSRNLEAAEELVMAHLTKINEVSGESKVDSTMVNALSKIIQTKRIIHEGKWAKSPLGTYASVTPELRDTIAPILRMYS